MSGTLNRVTLIGHLGADPEIRPLGSNGGEVCNLRLATSETWTDKQSGERREKTEWHRVSIFTPQLVETARRFLKKGQLVMIEGKLQTRKYVQDGQEKYSTDIVVQNFGGTMMMLGGRGSSAGGGQNDDQDNSGSHGGFSGQSNGGGNAYAGAPVNSAYGDGLSDDVPF